MPHCSWIKLLNKIIKDLTRHGILPGITEKDHVLDRCVTTMPHLTQLVSKYIMKFPQIQYLKGTPSTLWESRLTTEGKYKLVNDDALSSNN